MAHSKRNTSLAFFTAHERSLLKGNWGSQSTRLTRDSFLPFASCNLCLQPAVDPVACSINGEVFCRECIVNNLLAQRKEIKRLEKEDEKRKAEALEREQEKGEKDERSAVEDFERTMMGLEGRERKRPPAAGGQKMDYEGVGRGVKRKLQGDEEDSSRADMDERGKARKTTDDDEAAKVTLPSFWIPSMTPSSEIDAAASSSQAIKLQPLCPLSTPTSKHSISLKSLISIQFKRASSASASSGSTTYICPACDKTLSNASKAVMTVPCGHVLCKTCAGKFMSPDQGPPDPHADPEDSKQRQLVCYVCDTDLSTAPVKKKKSGEKTEKVIVKPGLVDLKSEGTGFAGGGDNMVTQKGTAFQC